jgi:hypothetical protein
VCGRLGLAPQQPGEDPTLSKRVYVRSRLDDKNLRELTAIASRVIFQYDDDELRGLYARLRLPTAEEAWNVVFASDGSPLRVELADPVGGSCDIVASEESRVVGAEPLMCRGLSWTHLLAWWQHRHPDCATDPAAAYLELHDRLRLGLTSGERLVFDVYLTLGFDLPALIPQVRLHDDPASELNCGRYAYPRHRVGFLLLMNNRARAVIEVDDSQHHPDVSGRGDDTAYAAVVAADRELTLQGFEVYRFADSDIRDPASARDKVGNFFRRLLDRHGHPLPGTAQLSRSQHHVGRRTTQHLRDMPWAVEEPEPSEDSSGLEHLGDQGGNR